MRISTATIAIQLGLALLAGSSKAQDVRAELPVYSTMDLYRAGGYDDGSDGIPPTVYSFAAKPGRILAFSSVAGYWNCQAVAQFFGPDGTLQPYCNPGATFPSIGTFGGFGDTDFTGGLVGMFLTDSLPSVAPPALRFYYANSSEGGIQTDFRSLAPKIGQVFYIGDGLTGTGSGEVQVFFVPATATHLYLGYLSSCTPTDVSPSCYSNHIGTLAAAFGLYSLK
jgi:hypothetical protein